MHPSRRLVSRGPLLLDLTPQRLVIYEGAQGVRRETQGDVPAWSGQSVVLAALEGAKNVWVGCGDGKVFSVGERASGSADALPQPFFDLTTEGDRLVGVTVDEKNKLNDLLVSDGAAREWRPLRMPKPVAAQPIPHYTLGERVRESPDGVLLDANPFGLTVLEQGRGRISLLRPGAPKLEGGLKLQPGGEQDTWRAVATPQGILVLLVANHRHSALAHFALDGTLLGCISEREDKPLWGGLGLCMLDATRALVFLEETHIVSLPGLELLGTVEGAEWRNYVVVAPAGPGRWWVGTQEQDDLALLTVKPGEPPHVTTSKRPVVPGKPLLHAGFTKPALEWDSGAGPLTVSMPVAETCRLTLRNDGRTCHGVRLRLSSPLIGARVVQVDVKARGTSLALTTQNRVDLVGELGGIDAGARLELVLTLTPRTEGTGPLTLTAEPLPLPGEEPGRAASTRVMLTVE